MNERHKLDLLTYPSAFRICHKYRKRNLTGMLMLLVLFSNSLFASPVGYPASYSQGEILVHLLNGEYNAD